MGLDALLATMETRPVVPSVTAFYAHGVTPKPSPVEACAPVTAVTPKIANVGRDAQSDRAHYRWRVTCTDRPPKEVCCVPERTISEIVACYPGATVEPLPDDGRKRAATHAEQVELAALVGSVYADDAEADRAKALAAALADPDGVLLCYRAIAVNSCVVRVPLDQDDRRSCILCMNFVPGSGRCRAAARGELADGVKRKYHPSTDLPRRCEAFRPTANDPNQRTGRGRWPSLTAGVGLLRDEG